MKALLLHTNLFRVKVGEKSTRPFGIESEVVRSSSEEMENGLTVLFCVEKGDGKQQIEGLYEEIIKSASEVGTKNLMLAPFVHLSKNIANPEEARQMSELLIKKFEGDVFQVKSSHFGYHKSLILDIKGHPGSFRYREF